MIIIFLHFKIEMHLLNRLSKSYSNLDNFISGWRIQRDKSKHTIDQISKSITAISFTNIASSIKAISKTNSNIPLP